jgi:hypothetical protein
MENAEENKRQKGNGLRHYTARSLENRMQQALGADKILGKGLSSSLINFHVQQVVSRHSCILHHWKLLGKVPQIQSY